MENYRKIKFRAWVPSQNRIVYQDFAINADNGRVFGYLRPSITNGSRVFDIDEFWKDKDYPIIQQFTGLLDKYGKEIYEGDILKCKGYDGWFDREGFYYNMEVKFSIHPAGDTQLAGFNYIPKDSEVIGNKFENGELLKK